MSSGHPDYMNVVRPRFGGAIMKWDIVLATASDFTLLRRVEGKGMIYGGAVWLDYTLTQANSEVWLKTDGFVLNDLSFVRLYNYQIINPRSAPVSLNMYDGTNYIYSVGLSYGITFQRSLELGYYERHGKTPTIHYRLVYALL